MDNIEKKKILVVDDQPGVQLLLKKRLEALGYEIVQAEDGEKGLWQFVDHKPDLILTDVVMPKMDGIEFFKRLRRIEGGESVPVIVISKRSLMKDCFDEDSIKGFFAKPFDMEALIAKIKVVFERRDLLKDLDAIREQEEKASGGSGRGSGQSGRMEICKKCGQEQTEDVVHCPNCGCTEFFIRES